MCLGFLRTNKEIRKLCILSLKVQNHEVNVQADRWDEMAGRYAKVDGLDAEHQLDETGDSFFRVAMKIGRMLAFDRDGFFWKTTCCNPKALYYGRNHLIHAGQGGNQVKRRKEIVVNERIEQIALLRNVLRADSQGKRP